MSTKRMPGVKRQAQIIQQATRLFARDGFEKVTMSRLAKSCRVTEAALYRHFRSKNQIYEAVLASLKDRLRIDEVLEELEAAEKIDAVLYGLAKYIVHTYTSNTELSRLLLFSALEGHPQARKTFEDLRGVFVKFLARKIRSLKRAGKVRDVHPLITARCFIGMVMDCSLQMHLWRRFQGETFKPIRVMQNNVPIYVEGLKKR